MSLWPHDGHKDVDADRPAPFVCDACGRREWTAPFQCHGKMMRRVVPVAQVSGVGEQ